MLPCVTYLLNPPVQRVDKIMDGSSLFFFLLLSLASVGGASGSTVLFFADGGGRSAGALMWNSLRETRRKLISPPGMRILDTAAPTIHPSSITSAFIILSPRVPQFSPSLALNSASFRFTFLFSHFLFRLLMIIVKNKTLKVSC